jgi:hypothetical protein
MNKELLERKILKVVRRSPALLLPREVADKVSSNDAEAREARECLRRLIDQGRIDVTLDWTLKVDEDFYA